MPFPTDFYFNDSLPVLIAQNRNWREDEKMLALYMWWLHSRHGLSWSQALYDTKLHIVDDDDTVKIEMLDGKVNIVSLVRDDCEELLGEQRNQADLVGSLIWHAKTVVITGLRDSQRDAFNRLLMKWNGQFDEIAFDGLQKKLMAEYVEQKSRKMRSSRLWRKLRSDPVLFFHDSEKFHGKLIYSLIKRLAPARQI